MATYTITAIVTKINSDGKVTLSGVGKYRYVKSGDEVFNLLENNDDVSKSGIFGQNIPFNLKINEVSKIIFAMAMLQKKPLKLTIEDSRGNYSITEVEVP